MWPGTFGLGINQWTAFTVLVLFPEFPCLFGHGKLSEVISLRSPDAMLSRAQIEFHIIAGFLDPSETMLGKWDGRWAAGVSLCIEAGHTSI